MVNIKAISDAEVCVSAFKEYLEGLDETLKRMAKEHGISVETLVEHIYSEDPYFFEEWQDNALEVAGKVESKFHVDIEHGYWTIQIRKGKCYLEVEVD